MPLSKVKTNSIATGNITSALIASVANTAITGNIASSQITSNPTLHGNVSVTGVIGVGGATPTSNGSGITFPATASVSTNVNTLDDYEEGTFTATFECGSSNPTITYGTRYATYTKIGNLVTVSINLVWSAASGGSGIVYVAGLPFAYTSTSGYSGGGAMGYTSGLPTNGLLYMDAGATRVVLVKTGGNGQTYFQAADISAGGGQIMLGLSYITDS